MFDNPPIGISFWGRFPYWGIFGNVRKSYWENFKISRFPYWGTFELLIGACSRPPQWENRFCGDFLIGGRRHFLLRNGQQPPNKTIGLAVLFLLAGFRKRAKSIFRTFRHSLDLFSRVCPLSAPFLFFAALTFFGVPEKSMAFVFRRPFLSAAGDSPLLFLRHWLFSADRICSPPEQLQK